MKGLLVPKNVANEKGGRYGASQSMSITRSREGTPKRGSPSTQLEGEFLTPTRGATPTHGTP